VNRKIRSHLFMRSKGIRSKKREREGPRNNVLARQSPRAKKGVDFLDTQILVPSTPGGQKRGGRDLNGKRAERAY